MNKIIKTIVAAFLPEHCPYCDKTVKAGSPACPECSALFPDTFTECYAKGGYKAVAPFMYTGIFSTAVKNYKFHNRVDYAEKLSKQIADTVYAAYKDIDFDCITCVPMHKNQLKQRGYNQSKTLAKKISKMLDIPYCDLLEKHKENEPQHSLRERQKRENVKGVYKAINTDRINGNNILIIDDIITTGYTLGECCETLRKAKAKKIFCAALCAKN